MENKNLYNKLESLPIEAQKQVYAFIDFLQNKYESRIRTKRLKGIGLSNEKFVGLWKKRAELEDSAKWLKHLRRKEWKQIG